MQEIRNFIDGEFVGTKECLDNFEPATGKPYSRVCDSEPSHIIAACQSAERALAKWSVLSAEKRGEYLLKLGAFIEDHLEEFAKAESVDTGKPLTLTRTVDIPRAVQNLRFFAGAAIHFSSESHSMGNSAINYTLRQPLGVVACISPWNLPLYLLTWKVAPALAAGNTVVAKPSEITPVTAFLLSQACTEIELPKGVLNIVHGVGARCGAALCADKRVKAISFTGGTTTGREIAKGAAPHFKRVSLEMGGKNPGIIFADADYEKMLETTVRSSFFNQGEICLSTSRLYIERSLYQRFRDDFVARVKALKQGDPLLEETDQGALVSATHLDRVLNYIALAKEQGTILCGGERAKVSGRCEEGYFVKPTVVEGLPPDSKLNVEEVFGPVVTLTPFDSESEVLSLANSTEYGLSAVIWTSDLARAHRLSAALQSGIVWVNSWLLRDLRTPFGGVKNSGFGREGGQEVMRFFTEPKNVCIKLYGQS